MNGLLVDRIRKIAREEGWEDQIQVKDDPANGSCLHCNLCNQQLTIDHMYTLRHDHKTEPYRHFRRFGGDQFNQQRTWPTTGWIIGPMAVPAPLPSSSVSSISGSRLHVSAEPGSTTAASSVDVRDTLNTIPMEDDLYNHRESGQSRDPHTGERQRDESSPSKKQRLPSAYSKPTVDEMIEEMDEFFRSHRAATRQKAIDNFEMSLARHDSHMAEGMEHSMEL